MVHDKLISNFSIVVNLSFAVLQIGIPSTDKDMLMIETENDVWGDIVGLNLRDHYTNLTVHTLLAFSWADR